VAIASAHVFGGLCPHADVEEATSVVTDVADVSAVAFWMIFVRQKFDAERTDSEDVKASSVLTTRFEFPHSFQPLHVMSRTHHLVFPVVSSMDSKMQNAVVIPHNNFIPMGSVQISGKLPGKSAATFL
jgi:hypothetical protein